MKPALSRLLAFRYALLAPVVLFLVCGCEKPQPAVWDGTYCYRWKEQYSAEEKTVEFLNTCSGDHEQMEVETREGLVYLRGPEGARALSLSGSHEAVLAVDHLDCNGMPYRIEYTAYLSGRNIILDTRWNDGTEHHRRTSYTLME
jgi:hypothetical protein